MDNLKDVVAGKFFSVNYKLEDIYQKEYDEDMTFRKVCNSIKLPKEIQMKYTTKIEQTVCELKNCSNCKNILECQNEVKGYVYYPEANGNIIEFAYRPCKYKKKLDKEKEYLNNIYYFDVSRDIRDASMKNIDIKDKNRFEVIKWIKGFINDTLDGIHRKGLYLNGNFGCGKTYLLSAMLNELAKNGKSVAIVYYPELLRSLKESFNKSDEYKEKFNKVKKVEFLLLDDIGAETNTEWSRDEVLGTILQYRMEEGLTTFFTSNLTIEEFQTNLAVTSKEVDNVKSRRIIERINQLSDTMTLISVNRRK